MRWAPSGAQRFPCTFCRAPAACFVRHGIRWFAHQEPACPDFIALLEHTASELERASARLLREAQKAKQHGPN